MKLASKTFPTKDNQVEQWVSLSDLMTSLMMVFMLIALAYMVKVEADSKKIRDIAVLYDQLRMELYQDLQDEFSEDLAKWGAELDKDSTIRFKEPEVLFATGKDELKPKFKAILDDFFPRYLRILTSDKYMNSVQEVRIEGHTSSIWNSNFSEGDAYFLNMNLSHNRTMSTLRYVTQLPNVNEEIRWLRKYLTANGLSSSKLILNVDGSENMERSQRVEFRVRTDAESKIARIIELVQQ